MPDASGQDKWPEDMQVLQVSEGPGNHSSIYNEVCYMDSTSRWVIYVSSVGGRDIGSGWARAGFNKQRQDRGTDLVFRFNLESGERQLLEENAYGLMGMAISPDQRCFFHTRRVKDSFELVRTDLVSGEQAPVVEFEGDQPLNSLGSVAQDLRSYVVARRLGPREFGLLRCDLERGTCQLIHKGGADLCNMHPQIEPANAQDILVQHNRGAEFDEDGRMLRLVGDIGATLYLIDRDGGNRRKLPVGKPYTHPVQGHQSWIGKTGEIILTIGASADYARREGNLLALRPGDEKARVVARGHVYCHPNASRDGRFFVADEFEQAALVVGSIRTGRTKLVGLTGASLGRSQYTHPHPYLSPDCRWVIFTSDRTGQPHVYALRIPDGVLESLEQEGDGY